VSKLALGVTPEKALIFEAENSIFAFDLKKPLGEKSPFCEVI
jgi:hypothetical protein